MSIANTVPLVARQVFAALEAHATDGSLPVLVRSLAKRGHVTLLQSIFGAELIDAAKWAGDMDMAYAILPLARHARPDEQAAARTLVQAWLGAFEGVRLADRVTYFVDCPDVDIARALLALGVDPLARVTDKRSKTVREHLFSSNNANSMIALLDTPGAANDRSLLALLLTEFIRPAAGYKDIEAWSQVWQHAEQNGVLAADSAQIGEQLTQVLKSAAVFLQSHSASFVDTGAYPVLQHWLQAMAWAEMSPAAWEELLNLSDGEWQLGSAMCSSPDRAPFAVPVIERMARAGVVFDRARMRCKGTSEPGTMLHAAMLADNVPVVCALLDAGANPDETLYIHGIHRDAASVAPKSRDAVRALVAWRARNAMRGVLKKAVATVRAENP